MAEVKMEKNSIVIEDGPESKPEKKDIQPVVKGQVKVQKKSVLKRVVDAFVGEDVGDVKEYLIYDVAIPSVKNLFFDLVSNGVSMVLFGDTNRARNNNIRRNGGTSYVSYSSIGNNRRNNDRTYARPNRRATHDFGDILFESRQDAEEVLSAMVDLVEIYGVATVSDLYDLVGKTSAYTDRGFGWNALGSSRVVRMRDGYILDLPPVEAL